MTNLTTRTTSSGIGVTAKGSPLTNSELDLNFISLNNSKVERSTSIIAIGELAGITQTTGCIAIGVLAGQNNQQENAFALGAIAGNTNQGQGAIAIGNLAGETNQSSNAIAIGFLAGQSNQQTDAIAIGNNAGGNNQCSNSIIINASGFNLESETSSALYIGPIRSADLTTYNLLAYNTSNSEVVKLPSVKLVPGSTSVINHLVVNLNTAGLAEAAPHFATSTGIIIQGADTSNTVLQLDTYGTGYAPYVIGRRSLGARGSEAPPAVGRNLLIMIGTGWVTSGFVGSKAQLEMTAAEDWNATSNGTYIAFRTTTTGSTTQTERIRIADNGNVGIGTTSPTWKVSVKQSGNTSNASLGLVSQNSADDSLIGIGYDNTSATMRVLASYVTTGSYKPISFWTADAERVRIGDNGNVSIGTSNTSTYKLQVAGSFAATTKSFLIDHPTRPGLQLQHGSLEGPENGVYVRGRLTNSLVIDLPDYWTELVDASTMTVNLTALGSAQQLYVDRIENNRVYIAGAASPDCFYTIWAERKDVAKLQVEI